LVFTNAFVKVDKDGHETIITVDPTEVSFYNSIVWGASDDEFIFGNSGMGEFSWKFDHCLLKTKRNTSDENYFSNCIINEDPKFVDNEEYNYKLDTLSPALKKGVYREMDFDIDGNPRNTEKPDLGAYEMTY
jgi:hypothetical protein